MPVKEARHERSHAIQFHLYEIFRTGRFVKMDRRLVVAGERKWGAIVYGRGVSSANCEVNITFFLFLWNNLFLKFCYIRYHIRETKVNSSINVPFKTF